MRREERDFDWGCWEGVIVEGLCKGVRGVRCKWISRLRSDGRGFVVGPSNACRFAVRDSSRSVLGLGSGSWSSLVRLRALWSRIGGEGSAIGVGPGSGS